MVVSIGKGNTKIGRKIYSFSIPALHTCIGHSQTCVSVCYALRSRLHTEKSLAKQWRNYQRSKTAGFVSEMICRIKAHEYDLLDDQLCFRIHVAGDFYSAGYVRKWRRIVRACPAVRFYAYTRSWRVSKVRNELDKLSREKNVRLWYSWDEETGEPKAVPRRVRLAYLTVRPDDCTPGRKDIVFRTHVLRKTVQKRLGLSLVCPPENGVSKSVTCEKCRLCFK